MKANYVVNISKMKRVQVSSNMWTLAAIGFT